MNAEKFVLIYFKTVKAKRSTQCTGQSEIAAKQNELMPQQRKSQRQNKLSKFIGSRFKSFLTLNMLSPDYSGIWRNVHSTTCDVTSLHVSRFLEYATNTG